ncbi:MAG: hypothetical protein HFH52_01295, partial [Lachnospiraceae bacterium]|nr:hypothetical protein [Lachnospiraceae bacterium]
MILLKANSELNNIFSRMLKTMDVNVVWTGNIVVLNNFLILSGKVRSLIFNFDNRKIMTNVIELPDKEEDMEPVGENQTLTNVLNMTLYAFGKWGSIRGQIVPPRAHLGCVQPQRSCFQGQDYLFGGIAPLVV